MTSTIDELDARLIALLRAEPRLGLMEASRRLGVARGTVQARLAKLEERGVVRAFGPEIDPGAPRLSRAGVRVPADRPGPAEGGRLGARVDPEVLEATATSGPSDLLCRIVARDTEHLQEIVNRLLSNNAIRRSTSYIALSQPIAFRTGAAGRRGGRGPAA